MKIKSRKEVKVISAFLITIATLLTCNQANSLPRGSSYVLPPSAPSNWIVNPANPIYFPRRNYRRSNGTSSSSVESLRAQQMECAREVYNRYNEPDRDDPSYPNFLVDLQDECVTPFLSK